MADKTTKEKTDDAKPDDAQSETSESSEATDVAKKDRLNPIVLAVGGIVAFAVFLGIFSYMMGVFDPPPPMEEAPASEFTDAAEGEGDSTGGAAEGHPTSHDDGGLAQDAGSFDDGYGFAAATDDEGDEVAEELQRLSDERAAVKKERAQLSRERTRLETLKREVEVLLGRKTQAELERINYLAKLLDGMKQEEAAAMMSNWDDETIVIVLPRMKISNASKILASMKAERAASITRMMLSLSSNLPSSKKKP